MGSVARATHRRHSQSLDGPRVRTFCATRQPVNRSQGEFLSPLRGIDDQSGRGGQKGCLKFACLASSRAFCSHQTFSSGPRPHSDFPFLPFEEMPGRLIHRNPSAYGDPVFVVGWVPSPALRGLHHFDFVPAAGFQKRFGSGPLAFSAVLTTKCLCSRLATALPKRSSLFVYSKWVAFRAKPRTYLTPALRSSDTASEGVRIQSDAPASMYAATPGIAPSFFAA